VEFESLAEAEGLAVLLDDRDSRPGEKFADADLIGAPWRATVGRKSLEDGLVDLRPRSGGVERRVSPSDVTRILNGT
jgi:prolyl-tRNA synthetase